MLVLKYEICKLEGTLTLYIGTQNLGGIDYIEMK